MVQNNRNSATAWPKEDLILSFNAFYSNHSIFHQGRNAEKHLQLFVCQAAAVLMHLIFHL